MPPRTGRSERREGDRPSPRRNAEQPPTTGSEPPRERFRGLDRYRVEREWQRLEGTPQRDLFRQLRVRFLQRHGSDVGPILEIGPGPGRFSRFLGPPETPRVLLDLSKEMLREARQRGGAGAEGLPATVWVQGDGLQPPFRDASFPLVSVIGNSIGFAGDDAARMLDSAAARVAVGGRLVVETVAGPGEICRCFHRLPPGEVRRILRAPPQWLEGRIQGEGFQRAAPAKRSSDAFRRLNAPEVSRILSHHGIEAIEVLAVAPLLGAEPERAEAVRTETAAWGRLLELEEKFGHEPERWEDAAALLIAGRRGASRPS